MHKQDAERLADAVRQATGHVLSTPNHLGAVPRDAARRIIGAFVDHMAEWILMLDEPHHRFRPDLFLAEAGFPRPDDPSPEVQAMATRYAAGATLAEVGREFGLTASAVSAKLRAAGVRLRLSGPRPGIPRPPCQPAPDAATVQKMAARYEAGATLAEVGSEFGYHGSTVGEHLRKAGVRIRRPGERGQ